MSDSNDPEQVWGPLADVTHEVWEDVTIRPGTVVSDVEAPLHRFIRFGAKNVTFKNCVFKYARFEDGYFHRATFVDCSFTGAVFDRCVFRGATFERCDFSYARFSRTIISPEVILNRLPLAANLRRDLCQELRKNYESLGDGAAARKSFFKEMGAEASHYWQAVKADQDYYRDKYGGKIWTRVKMAWRLVVNRTGRLLWGGGESPVLVLWWSFIGLLALSGVALLKDYADTYWDAIYLTGMTFLSIGPVREVSTTSATVTPQGFLLVTGFLGYAVLGLFVAALFRRLARR